MRLKTTTKRAALDRESAQDLAIKALVFLAEDGTRLGRFLSLTGMAPNDIREVASTSSFQSAVLEHLLADESLLLAFAANAGLAPDQVQAAAHLLQGSAEHD